MVSARTLYAHGTGFVETLSQFTFFEPSRLEFDVRRPFESWRVRRCWSALRS